MAIIQAPAEAARPWIQGQRVACLHPSLCWYRIIMLVNNRWTSSSHIANLTTASVPSSFSDSVLIQCWNAVTVLGTFAHTTSKDEIQPSFVTVFSLVFSPQDLYNRQQLKNKNEFKC